MFIWLPVLSEEGSEKLLGIFNKYKRYMYTIAYEILRTEEKAEDAVSEAILKLSDNLDKLGNVDDFRTKGFVAIVVKNVAIDMYRKTKGRNLEFDESYMGSSPDISEDYMKKEQYKALMRELYKLPDRYKSVLVLRYVNNLSDEDIANTLDITKENVRKRAERGRKALITAMDMAGELYD